MKKYRTIFWSGFLVDILWVLYVLYVKNDLKSWKKNDGHLKYLKKKNET